jgi:hypothetical protein
LLFAVYREREQHVAGMPPAPTYPESTNSMPPAMAGPAPPSDPPRAGTPLTV